MRGTLDKLVQGLSSVVYTEASTEEVTSAKEVTDLTLVALDFNEREINFIVMRGARG